MSEIIQIRKNRSSNLGRERIDTPTVGFCPKKQFFLIYRTVSSWFDLQGGKVGVMFSVDKKNKKLYINPEEITDGTYTVKPVGKVKGIHRFSSKDLAKIVIDLFDLDPEKKTILHMSVSEQSDDEGRYEVKLVQ